MGTATSLGPGRWHVRPMHAAVVSALVLLAGTAWMLTADRMAGMDAAPGADLGGLGWFTVSWVVMMAAMMLPSLVPATLAVARRGSRRVGGFVAGYLAAWTAAGLLAYAVVSGLRALDLSFLAWDAGGRSLAAGIVLAAAAYQFTRAKARCLSRCRDDEQRHGSPRASIVDGTRHAAWCIGCCATLMAALFALGVMSLTWMVVVAVMVSAERLLPWPRPAAYTVAGVLVVLAVWMALAPSDLPGLTLPGAIGGM